MTLWGQRVTAVQGDRVTLDWGSARGVVVGMRAWVAVREEAGGQAADAMIARIRVVSVTEDGAAAVVEERSEGYDLVRGQRVEWIDRPAAPGGPNAGTEREFGGMRFVWIPPGSFTMGSPQNEEGRDSDEVQHRVTLTKGYWLGKYEVTQDQWRRVMGTNPSRFRSCGGKCPVEQVSWNDVQEFIRKLNAAESGNPYRLPTEAEWEYAARAGTTGLRHREHDAVAWYEGNSGRTTHPVGTKAANDWGLHDMLGNVWEWTADWHGAYPGGAVTDPQGPPQGSVRVYRGGSWVSYARVCRSANRNWSVPSNRISFLGFRLARVQS
jgi:formylglycine-generating enzyme required for sulfatase activity